MKKLSLILSSILLVAMSFMPQKAEAGWFMDEAMRILYDNQGGSGSLSFTQNGLEITYSYSGSNAIAIEKYCTIWFSRCPRSWHSIDLIED